MTSELKRSRRRYFVSQAVFGLLLSLSGILHYTSAADSIAARVVLSLVAGAAVVSMYFLIRWFCSSSNQEEAQRGRQNAGNEKGSATVKITRPG